MSSPTVQELMNVACLVWDWFIDGATTAVVTWLGSALGLFAIYLTYRQAAEAASKAEGAETAAEKAEMAAERAVDALRNKLSLATLVYSHSQIGVLKSLVSSKEVSAARITYHPLGRSLSDICAFLSRYPSMNEEVQVVRKNMKAIEFQLDLLVQNSAKADVFKVERALNGIASFLADAENKLKYGHIGEELV